MPVGAHHQKIDLVRFDRPCDLPLRLTRSDARLNGISGGAQPAGRLINAPRGIIGALSDLEKPKIQPGKRRV